MPGSKRDGSRGRTNSPTPSTSSQPDIGSPTPSDHQDNSFSQPPHPFNDPAYSTSSPDFIHPNHHSTITNNATPTHHQPTTNNNHQPITASTHQPPPSNNYQPPPSNNHQPPPSNNHQPPPSNNHQPPPFNNHQPPLFNNHHPPTVNHHHPPPTSNHHLHQFPHPHHPNPGSERSLSNPFPHPNHPYPVGGPIHSHQFNGSNQFTQPHRPGYDPGRLSQPSLPGEQSLTVGNPASASSQSGQPVHHFNEPHAPPPHEQPLLSPTSQSHLSSPAASRPGSATTTPQTTPKPRGRPKGSRNGEGPPAHLKGVDRNSARTLAVTVHGLTVVITDYKLKPKRPSPRQPDHHTAKSTDPSPLKEEPSPLKDEPCHLKEEPTSLMAPVTPPVILPDKKHSHPMPPP